METIAVYWEEKIRVYGLNRQTGLSMHTLVFPADRLVFWSGRLAELERFGCEFQLVNLQTVAAGSLQICLVLDRDHSESAVLQLFREGLQGQNATSARVTSPVELLYLHGPHFQDRYGIAEAAIAPLCKAEIPTLATACSGASIFIVVPENRSQHAADCLAETFAL